MAQPRESQFLKNGVELAQRTSMPYAERTELLANFNALAEKDKALVTNHVRSLKWMGYPPASGLKAALLRGEISAPEGIAVLRAFAEHSEARDALLTNPPTEGAGAVVLKSILYLRDRDIEGHEARKKLMAIDEPK